MATRFSKFTGLFKFTSVIRHLLFFLLLMFGLFAVVIAWREKVVVTAVNHWGPQYGITLTQFTDLSVRFEPELRISLARADLDIDYAVLQQQLQKKNPAQSTEADQDVTVRDPLSVLSAVPALRIAEVNLNFKNLPQSTGLISALPLSIRQIEYSRDLQPQFSASVWSLSQLLLKLNGGYQAPFLSAQVDFKLEDISTLVSPLLLYKRLSVNGLVSTHLKLDPADTTQIAVRTNIENMGFTLNKHDLFQQLTGYVSSELDLTGGANPLISEIDAELTSLAPLNITFAQCQQLTSLLNVSVDSCQSLQELGVIGIELKSPIALQFKRKKDKYSRRELASIRVASSEFSSREKKSSEQTSDEVASREGTDSEVASSELTSGEDKSGLRDWQLGVDRVWAGVGVMRSELDIDLSNLVLSTDKLRGDWRFDGTSELLEQVKAAQLSAAGSFDLQVSPAEPKQNDSQKGQGKEKQKQQKIVVKLTRANVDLAKIKLPTMSVKQASVTLSEPAEFRIVNGDIGKTPLAFNTQLKSLHYRAGESAKRYDIKRISGGHLGELDTTSFVLKSDWQLDQVYLSSDDRFRFQPEEPIKISGKWRLPKQSFDGLLAILDPLPAEFAFSPPGEPESPSPTEITTQLSYQLSLGEGSLQFSSQLAGSAKADTASYDEVELSSIGIDWQCQGSFKTVLSAGCDIMGHLDTVDVGLPITNLTLNSRINYVDNAPSLKLYQADGALLGGRFWFEPLLITDFNDITGMLRLRDISLSKILELQPQPGITVTGLLQGQLPLFYSDEGVAIKDGFIEQQGSGGVIQIRDNATVEQLKQTQPHLKFAFDVLENLHYDSLHSDLNYHADGQTILKTSIRGRNPDFERPIELNYSHEENVLQLLRSLRIGDSMSKAIEKSSNY